MGRTEAPVWSPDCMEPSDWTDWQRMNARIQSRNERAERPCADCPASFAAEMRAVERCNGFPRGDEMSDGNGVAVLSRPAVLTGRELPVALTLPCDRCAHAPVCRIKPTLEARLESLPVTLPTLDPAVTVAVSATVECRQFMRASAKPGVKPKAQERRVIASPSEIDARQSRVVDALRAAAGNAREAADASGVDYKTVQNDIRSMRDKGTLPDDIETMLDRRRAERLA